MPRVVNGTLNHGHSATAGDGGALDASALGAIDAASMTSGTSNDGQVLTSDGSGGAAWEDVPVSATVPDHAHAGAAGDGNQIRLSVLDSPAAATNFLSMQQTLGVQMFHGIWKDEDALGGHLLETDLSWSDANVKLTITSKYSYYWRGERIDVAANNTCDLDDFKSGETVETGLWYIYHNGDDGVLYADQVGWTIGFDYVQVATVFWNGSAGAVSYEGHVATRDKLWHRTHHLTVGSMYQTGFDLTSPAVGANFSAIQLSSGTIWDEDIAKTTSGNSTNCRLWYQTGASTYTFENSNRAHLWSGAAVQYINSAAYAKTAISGAQRAVTWIYASTDIDRCLYVICDPAASAPYASLPAARAATPPNLVGFGMSNELKLLYRCIWSATDLVEIQDYRRSSALPAGGTSPVAASAVVYVPTGQTSATNVQAAIDELRVQTGSIVRWSSATIPSGYLECLGQAVSRTTYAQLFSVIGTAYGDGDGATTFNMPRVYSRQPLVPMMGTSRTWRMMCATAAGDVYAAVDSGDIYKRTGWDGAFTALSQSSLGWWGMCAAPNGNIYASVYGGDIYMQTAGAGNFTALSQATRNWIGMAATAGNNIYCAVSGGDIYMQTAGTGDFAALSQTSRSWTGMCVSAAGNVYAGVTDGDVYMQTAGTGDFAALGQTARKWLGLYGDTNGDVYATAGEAGVGAVYRQLGGTGPFVLIPGETTLFRTGVCCHPNGSLLVATSGGDIDISYTDRAIIKT